MPDSEGIAEAAANFVLIVQGTVSNAVVVEGIEGLKQALMQSIWSDPEQAVLEEAAAVLASLDDPASWAAHGQGDGRPYWHWWLGYDGGSVTAQRLTQPLPANPAADRLRSSLAAATGALTACAADLRALSGTGQRDYVFARRPGRQAGSE